MKRAVLFISVAAVMIFTGCAKENGQKQTGKSSDNKVNSGIDNLKKMPFHGDMQTANSGSTPLIDALKATHLKEYPKKTIGEIFDPYQYALKKQWLETATASGGYYIDYICWFYVNPLSVTSDPGSIKEKGVNIKFAVDKDGTTYVTMAQNLVKKADDKLYSTPLYPEQIKALVNTIYENKEYKF